LPSPSTSISSPSSMGASTRSYLGAKDPFGRRIRSHARRSSPPGDAGAPSPTGDRDRTK
jgi:hypothetical protein